MLVFDKAKMARALPVHPSATSPSSEAVPDDAAAADATAASSELPTEAGSMTAATKEELRKMMKEEMEVMEARLHAQLRAQTAARPPVPPPLDTLSHDAVFGRIMQDAGTTGFAVPWADFERAFSSIYLDAASSSPDVHDSTSSRSDRAGLIRKTAAHVTGFPGVISGKHGTSHGNEIARLRADMDTNGDGFINRAEWAHWHQRWVAAGTPPMAAYLAHT